MNNPSLRVYVSEIEKFRLKIQNDSELLRSLNTDELLRAKSDINYEISNYENARSDTENLIEDFEDKISNLKSDKQTLENDISDLQDELSSLYSELSYADKEDRRYIKSEIRACKAQIREKKEEIREIEYEINIYEKKLQKAKTLLNIIGKNLQKLQSEKTHVEKLTDKVESFCVKLIRKIEYSIEMLQKSISHANEYLEVKIEKLEQFKCNIDSLDSTQKSYKRTVKTSDDYEAERNIKNFGEKAVNIARNLDLDTRLAFSSILSNISANNIEILYNLLEQIKEKYPDKYQAAIQYIAAKGIYAQDGIYDLKKMLKDGNLSESILSESVIEMTRRIYSSQLKKETEKIRNKNAIRLSKYKEDRIWKDPEYLRMIVEQETGKTFEEGFQEFFIRLAKSNNQFQIERIWNASQEIYRNISKENNQKAKAVIKDAIRPGGVHEWLMCENFGQFLYDTKWRKDGAFLVMLLTELVQDTENVFLENVEIWDKDKEEYVKKDIWGHNDEANKNSKYNTMGGANNPNSIIHNLIRECVENSSSAAELLVNLDQRVKAMFSEKTYEEFRRKLDECLA